MKITQEMKDMISSQLGYISTVDENGMPNVGPKRSMRLYDDETIVFNENTGKHTMHNINENGKVAIAYVNWDKLKGFRFIGTATIETEGKMYDEAVEWAKGKMGKPLGVGIVKITEVYNLNSGPEAGNKLL